LVLRKVRATMLNEQQLNFHYTLIDQVRRGTITPEEANDSAAKQSFGPIATTPDPLEFDPEQIPWWSLPMPLAWIAWRNSYTTTVQLVSSHSFLSVVRVGGCCAR
jgi:hypothetical protein